jgi:hypothetical protein
MVYFAGTALVFGSSFDGYICAINVVPHLELIETFEKRKKIVQHGLKTSPKVEAHVHYPDQCNARPI